MPDTVSDVIHDAAERPSGRKRSGVVDNSADSLSPIVHKLSTLPKAGKPAGKVVSPENRSDVCAASQPRSHGAKPSRLCRRSSACDVAPAQKSKRTTTLRGLCIRSAASGLLAQPGVKTKPFKAKPGNAKAKPATAKPSAAKSHGGFSPPAGACVMAAADMAAAVSGKADSLKTDSAETDSDKTRQTPQVMNKSSRLFGLLWRFRLGDPRASVCRCGPGGGAADESPLHQ